MATIRQPWVLIIEDWVMSEYQQDTVKEYSEKTLMNIRILLAHDVEQATSKLKILIDYDPLLIIVDWDLGGNDHGAQFIAKLVELSKRPESYKIATTILERTYGSTWDIRYFKEKLDEQKVSENSFPRDRIRGKIMPEEIIDLLNNVTWKNVTY